VGRLAWVGRLVSLRRSSLISHTRAVVWLISDADAGATNSLLSDQAPTCNVLVTMVRLRAWGLGGLSFGFFLIVNPLFVVSCGENSEFEYDEHDMLAVVDDLNEAAALPVSAGSDEQGYQLRFAIEQSVAGGKTAHLAPESSWISQAHACTQRTFVEEAGACMSTSELRLQGTLFVEQEGSVVHTLDVEGSMFVMGKRLRGADFFFNFDGGTVSLNWEGASAFTLDSIEGELLSGAR